VVSHPPYYRIVENLSAPRLDVTREGHETGSPEGSDGEARDKEYPEGTDKGVGFLS